MQGFAGQIGVHQHACGIQGARCARRLCANCCSAAGGAVGMTGLTPDQDPSKDGVPLDPPPSTRQGYGRMQLSNSLPLSSGSSHLQVCTHGPTLPICCTVLFFGTQHYVPATIFFCAIFGMRASHQDLKHRQMLLRRACGVLYRHSCLRALANKHATSQTLPHVVPISWSCPQTGHLL